MTHHIVKLTRKFHYYETTVSFERSLDQIKELLTKHGCARIADMQDHRGEAPLRTIVFEKDGVPFMIQFPVTYMVSGKLNMNISGRIVFYKIKTLLVDYEIGTLSFTQAMSPYLALPTANGPQPMQDFVGEFQTKLTSNPASIFPQLGRG